jgi:HlyD family secretion protein
VKLRWPVILLVTIGILAGVGYLANRPKPLEVELTTATQNTLEQTVVNTRAGTVVACRRAELSPASGGVVTQLAVKKGDRVKQGDLLMQLWNADIRAELALATTELTSTQAQTDEACTLADWADRDAKRQQRLLNKAMIAEDNVDRATAEAQAKRARCNASRIAVDISRKRIDSINATLERTQLLAPFPGVVAETNAELGEYVTPSPPGIATRPPIDLIDDSCLFIRAPVDETDAAAVKVSLPARITLDALPGKIFSGHVSRIAPYVLDREKQARTVDIEVQFDHAAESAGLLVGYSADIEIVLQKRDAVISVLTSSLDANGALWIYDETSQTVRPIKATQGLRNWTQTEITEGISAGQKVVLSPNLKLLRDGIQVREKHAEAAGNNAP